MDKGVAKAAGGLLPPRPAAVSSPSFPLSRNSATREAGAPGRAGFLRWIYPPRCGVLRLTHLPGGGAPRAPLQNRWPCSPTIRVSHFGVRSPARFSTLSLLSCVTFKPVQACLLYFSSIFHFHRRGRNSSQGGGSSVEHCGGGTGVNRTQRALTESAGGNEEAGTWAGPLQTSLSAADAGNVLQ